MKSPSGSFLEEVTKQYEPTKDERKKFRESLRKKFSDCIKPQIEILRYRETKAKNFPRIFDLAQLRANIKSEAISKDASPQERRKIRNSLGLSPAIPRRQNTPSSKKREKEEINSISSFSYGSSSSGDVRINISTPLDLK